MSQVQLHTRGLTIHSPVGEGYADILTPEALHFVEWLVREFTQQRDELLRQRADRQHDFDEGIFPDFLPDTDSVRQSSWSVAPIPDDLMDRRVEITGPTGPEDDHQCAEFRSQRLPGRF